MKYLVVGVCLLSSSVFAADMEIKKTLKLGPVIVTPHDGASCALRFDEDNMITNGCDVIISGKGFKQAPQGEKF